MLLDGLHCKSATAFIATTIVVVSFVSTQNQKKNGGTSHRHLSSGFE